MLRVSEIYIDAQGRLTQAGYLAFTTTLNAQAARITALEAKIAAAAAVANASGGATVDTQARTQLAGIRTALT
jgi:hypothetical protein